METRYYLDESKPSGVHKLALHSSKQVYDRIKGHRDRKERLMAEVEKEANYRKYLRDGTKAMTEKWENSVEFLRKKKEEARQQKLTQKVDDRVEQYHKVVERQAEERRKYNEQVAYKRFITTGPQRDLNSAIWLSNCHFENEKQIELKKKERDRIDADWKAYEQKIIDEDETFKKNDLIKECERKKKAEYHHICLMRQIDEKQKQKEDEKRTKLENDQIDIVKQMEEMNILNKIAQEDVINAKSYCLNALKNSRDIRKREEEASVKRETEMEIVAQIFRDTKTKIECERMRMRKEEVKKAEERQQAACKVLTDIYNQKQDIEDQLLSKAFGEQEEVEEMKAQEKREYEHQLVQDRKKDFENALSKKKKKRDEELEMARWEMLNQMKFREIVGTDQKDADEKRQKKMTSYCKVLNEQVEENRRLLAEKKAEEESFKWHNYPEMDQNFLNYANEMLATQREAGKPTYPLEHVVMEYKKKNGLIRPNTQKTSLCSAEKHENKKKFHNTRRICPVRNESSKVKDCFCS